MGDLMVFMISRVSAARGPPGSLPSCFSSISPPERWFQTEKLSTVCLDHDVRAIVEFCECSCFAKIIFPAYFVTWDHHHCVSRHFLLQNDGFKPKNCQQCALITMFVLFLSFVNVHASQKIIFPAYFVTWDYHHCVSRHFLLQNDGFKSKNCQQCGIEAWCCENADLRIY